MGVFFSDPDVELDDIFWYNALAIEIEDSLIDRVKTRRQARTWRSIWKSLIWDFRPIGRVWASNFWTTNRIVYDESNGKVHIAGKVGLGSQNR